MTVSLTPSELPDYGQLVKFLFQPFLSVAEGTSTSLDPSLSVDCEYTIDRHRVWIRVAIANADQGSAFGRGGRNIQAIRTVLQAAATVAGQSVNLDVYGNNSGSRSEYPDRSARSDKPDTGSGSRSPRSVPTRRSASGDRPDGSDGSSAPSPRPRR